MTRIFVRLASLAPLLLAGCHFRAGLGAPPPGPAATEHSTIRDTVESADGSKKINETDKTTTTTDDGRSTTIETVTATTVEPDGSTAKSRTQTTTERSPSGTVSTSSSSNSN